MLIAIIAWGIYSAFLKKRKIKVSLLALVQVICHIWLIFFFQLFYLNCSGKNILNE